MIQTHIRLLPYQQTPVQDISHFPPVQLAGVKLLVKREDLNHPEVSGNKWWKLRHNLEAAIEAGHTTVLTFGGAYSNHIYATAAAAHALGLKSIGVIRGEEHPTLNNTLQYARNHGMVLNYVDRQAYRNKESPEFIARLEERWGPFYLIPEGGTNALAVSGCEELGHLLDAIPADYIVLPVGTGGTMAGIIKGLSPDKIVLGISVLKGSGFLADRVSAWVGETQTNWQLLTDYAYGGYAKRHPVVIQTIEVFNRDLNIPLEFVYTGKMMSAVLDLAGKGYFTKGKTILAVHTGGLQGQL